MTSPANPARRPRVRRVAVRAGLAVAALAKYVFGRRG